ncbi:MAG: hypothetical protein ACKOW3_02630 [Hyphomicrobium sp.]
MLVFTASHIWTNYDNAKRTLYHEAGALRSILILGRTLPPEQEKNIRNLVDKHIQQTINIDWPQLIKGQAYGTQSPDLVEAFDYTFSLKPQDETHLSVQKRVLDKWDVVRDARRERIFISRRVIHPTKIGGLFLIVLCFFTAVAFVHCDNKKTCALALLIFSTTIGMSLFLLAAYAIPFSGNHAVASQEILMVIPSSIPCRCEI